MQESGRSAKEKPSRKGWASMCDISLIVLSGRLRQAPVVGFQAGKIVPGLGIGCLQLCHILRGRLSSARKHHMTFFSESHSMHWPFSKAAFSSAFIMSHPSDFPAVRQSGEMLTRRTLL